MQHRQTVLLNLAWLLPFALYLHKQRDPLWQYQKGVRPANGHAARKIQANHSAPQRPGKLGDTD
jgi:hypothetical protein